MVGDLDPFEFELALALHRTVKELRATMDNAEYYQWAMRDTYLTEMAKLAAVPEPD